MSFLAAFRAGLPTPAASAAPPRNTRAGDGNITTGATEPVDSAAPAGTSPVANQAAPVQTPAREPDGAYGGTYLPAGDAEPSGLGGDAVLKPYEDIPWTTPAEPVPLMSHVASPPPGNWLPDPNRRPPKPVWIVLAGAIAAIAMVGAGVFALRSGPSLDGLSPAQILQKSTAAALRAATVHGIADNTVGKDSTRVVMDLSPSGGVETMSYDGRSAQAIGIGNSLYFKADAGSMSQLFAIPDAQASRLANEWLVMPPDDTDIQQMAQQLQTPVLVKNLLTLSAPVTRVASGHHGEVVLRGKVPDNAFNQGSGAGDTATLVISSSSPFLPISLSYSDAQNGSTKVTFSHWKERFRLAAPASSTPLAALGSSTGKQAGPPVQAVTTTSTQPGVSVTLSEANLVATELWQERVQARADMDVAGLQAVEAQPALAADYGGICQWGCPGPPDLTLQTMNVTVTQQSGWPAVFFATASYTTDCLVSTPPCRNTFVAVQQAPGAPWKIALTASWSGTVDAAIPPASDASFSPAPQPAAGAHVDTLPGEYAAYLQSIKDTGQPPAGSRLAAGPFTTGRVQDLYLSPSAQQSAGEFHTVKYWVDPHDAVWHFAGAAGTVATCGTVRFVDQVRPAPGHLLSQSAADHRWGNLAAGTYSSVTLTGLHMVCFETYSDPGARAVVFGDWGDLVSTTGDPVTAVVNPN